MLRVYKPYDQWLFPKIGVPFEGVLKVRALIFGVHIPALDFWKLPRHSYTARSKARNHETYRASMSGVVTMVWVD